MTSLIALAALALTVIQIVFPGVRSTGVSHRSGSDCLTIPSAREPQQGVDERPMTEFGDRPL